MVMVGGEVDVCMVVVMVEMEGLFEGVVVSTACPGKMVEVDGGISGVVMDEAIVYRCCTQTNNIVDHVTMHLLTNTEADNRS